jgi:hypothetical protein
MQSGGGSTGRGPNPDHRSRAEAAYREFSQALDDALAHPSPQTYAVLTRAADALMRAVAAVVLALEEVH